MRWSFVLFVSVLFLLSGATALVYQVAWTRNLSLIFGASHQAIAIVLSAFMAGLGLGGYWLGRRSARLRRPLRVYGLLEYGVAVAALALPLLLTLVQRAYVDVAIRIEGVPWSLNALRLILAFALLLVPTFFMGGTLPVLTRAVVRGLGDFGPKLAWLYGINTGGAVVGAALAGFLLLPRLGLLQTQLLAIVANISIATLAVVADARVRRATAADSRAAETSAERRVTTPADTRSLGRDAWALRLAFWGTFVSGLCALALEVMWTRGIAMAIGTTTYSFTIMLCAFLVGITLGSAIHGLMPLRRLHETAHLGLVLLGIGISSAIVSQQIPQLPQLAVELNMRFYGGSEGVRAASTLLVSFIVMLVPATLMGIAFPLAARARARLGTSFGGSVGDIVGLNTLGGILGPLLAGFLLIPFLGLQRSMLLVCALDLGYGVLLLGAFAASRTTRPLLLTSLALPLAVVAGVALPATFPRWDLHTLGAFQNNVTLGYTNAAGVVDVRGQLASVQVLYYDEGRGATVSVAESNGFRAVLINGKSVATDYQTDLQHEYLLGHLPVLLHRDPRSVLVIGLGAGLTLGGVTAHPGIEQVTLVEIEPAVVGAARVFEDLNGAALDDPRVRIVVQDGRNHLLTTRERYDVITADPIHPWAYGAASLYTREYYELIRRRLSDEGVMCQWMPIYELSEENLRSIVATFCDAFEHATLWQTAFDAVLIGSKAPIGVDLEALESRLRTPEVATQLGRIGLADPLSFLAEFTMDDATVREYAAGGILNRDDNLYLEFSSPLSIGDPTGGDNILKLDALRQNAVSLLTNAARFGSQRQLSATLERYRRAKRGAVTQGIAFEEAWQAPTEAAWDEVVERLRSLLAQLPEYGRARVLLAAALTGWARFEVAAGRLQSAREHLGAAIELDPLDAHAPFHLAQALLAQGRSQEAVLHLERAVELRQRFPGARVLLGRALADAGRLEEAVLQLQRAVKQEPQRADARYELGVVETRRQRLGMAEQRFRETLELDPGHVPACVNLAVVLTAQGRRSDAIAALQRGLEVTPGDPTLSQRLDELRASRPQSRPAPR
ncbi:MAG: fused MFS/spermidine synthase [Candidatus Latescibacterota bacterium]|nr:MAG: fused MFS/spermidine synthase [Candidatus Latescibacterota bacterium]